MNKKFFSLILVFLVILALPVFAAGAKEEAKTEPVTEPVVEVVDTVVENKDKVVATVTLGDFKSEIMSSDVEELKALYKENGVEATDEQVLEELISQALINLEFQVKDYQLTDELTSYLINYYFTNYLGVTLESQEQLDAFVQQYQIDLQNVVSTLASQYFLQAYLAENYNDILSQTTTPEESAVAELYNLNKDLFKNSEKVKIAHIYFEIKEDTAEADVKAKADEVYAKIKNGEVTFEKAVSDYSDDTDTNNNAGILGWVNSAETDFEKELAVLLGNYNIASSEYHKQLFTEDTYNKIIAMNAGEVSEPLKSTSGYHIFKAIVRNEEKSLGQFDAAYPEVGVTVNDYLVFRLSEALSEQYYNQAVAQMLSDLRATAEVVYN